MRTDLFRIKKAIWGTIRDIEHERDFWHNSYSRREEMRQRFECMLDLLDIVDEMIRTTDNE
jgi:hypothetical protein